MDLFTAVRKIVSGSAKKPAGNSEITAALAAAEERRVELIHRRDEIEARRLDAIVAGDGERAARRSELADLLDELLDLNAITDALQQRLVEAERADAEAARKRQYAEAIRVRDAAAAEFKARYPQHAKGLVDLMRCAAEADIAVQSANANLPAGAERLLETELVARSSPGLPQKVVAEERFAAWAPIGDDSPQPVPAGIASRIEIDKETPERGFIRVRDVPAAEAYGPADQFEKSRNGMVSLVNRYERRLFRRREILDSVPGERPPALFEVHLPGLVGGEADFWKCWHPGHVVEPDMVLRWIEDQAHRQREPAYAPQQSKRVEIIALPHDTGVKAK